MSHNNRYSAPAELTLAELQTLLNTAAAEEPALVIEGCRYLWLLAGALQNPAEVETREARGKELCLNWGYVPKAARALNKPLRYRGISNLLQFNTRTIHAAAIKYPTLDWCGCILVGNALARTYNPALMEKWVNAVRMNPKEAPEMYRWFLEGYCRHSGTAGPPRKTKRAILAPLLEVGWKVVQVTEWTSPKTEETRLVHHGLPMFVHRPGTPNREPLQSGDEVFIPSNRLLHPTAQECAQNPRLRTYTPNADGDTYYTQLHPLRPPSSHMVREALMNQYLRCDIATD